MVANPDNDPMFFQRAVSQTIVTPPNPSLLADLMHAGFHSNPTYQILDVPGIDGSTCAEKGTTPKLSLPENLSEPRWHDELTIRLRFIHAGHRDEAMRAAVNAMNGFLPSPAFDLADTRCFEQYQRFE